MKKNDIFELNIEAVTAEGAGIGRVDGMAVFVPRTAPGDSITARAVKVLSSYAYGITEELLTPSPARCDPECEVYSRCGGCALRHISYEEELRQKSAWVADAMRRIGGLDIPMLPIIPSPRQQHYRNKAQYPIGLADGRIRAGFYAPRSHRLIPAEQCPLQPESFAAICRAFCGWAQDAGASVYDEASGKGLLRHLYLRRGEVSGETLVCIVAAGKRLPQTQELIARLREVCPETVGVVLNINTRNTNVILGRESVVLWGSGSLRDTLAGVEVELSPEAFYQVNHGGAELLYAEARRMAALSGGETLLDLYCGTGTIGLSMAKDAGRLIGVEVIPEAVRDAQRNAARNGIAGARFLCADAGEAAAQLASEGVRPEVVLLDPPRKGCDAKTLAAITEMSAQRIVMISCNPATAARDIAVLAKSGYAPIEARPVDMFPRTGHVEAVVLLSNLPSPHHI